MYSSATAFSFIHSGETILTYIKLRAKKSIYMKFLTENMYVSKMHFLVGYLETEA